MQHVVVVERFWRGSRLSIERAPTKRKVERVMVRPFGDGAQVMLTPGMDVTVRAEKAEPRTLTQLQRDGALEGSVLTLALGEVADIIDGDLTWRVRFAAAEQLTAEPWLQRMDLRWFKALSMTVMTAAALFAIVSVEYASDETIFGAPQAPLRAVFRDTTIKPRPKMAEAISQAINAAKASVAQFQRDVRPAAKGGGSAAKELLSVMFNGGGGGGVGLNAMLNAANDLGPGQGPGAGDGLSGMNVRGNGGPLGVAGLGLGGPIGTRRGGPHGPGGVGGGLGNHQSVVPCESGCKQSFGDGLPRDVIAKVIRRHQSEIKFCYEQALQRDASLAGKVAVQFTIGGTGEVADAQVAESSLGNADVERCVVDRIRAWKFPEPMGGGVVAVTYPWLFRAAGSED